MEDLQKAVAYLQSKGVDLPETGVVLGTGLGQFLQFVDVQKSIPYSEIPGFPIATVEFHKGNLIFGSVGKNSVVVMQGRFHAYEGYSPERIVFPVRVMKLLGIQRLL